MLKKVENQIKVNPPMILFWTVAGWLGLRTQISIKGDRRLIIRDCIETSSRLNRAFTTARLGSRFEGLRLWHVFVLMGN